MRFDEFNAATKRMVGGVHHAVSTIALTVKNAKSKVTTHITNHSNPHGTSASDLKMYPKSDAVMRINQINGAGNVIGGKTLLGDDFEQWENRGAKMNLIRDYWLNDTLRDGKLIYPLPTAYGNLVTDEIVLYKDLPKAVVDSLPTRYHDPYGFKPNAWHIKFDNPPTTLKADNEGWYYFAPMAYIPMQGWFTTGFCYCYVVSGEAYDNYGSKEVIQAGHGGSFLVKHQEDVRARNIDSAFSVKANTEVYLFLPFIVPSIMTDVRQVALVEPAAKSIFYGM